MFILKTNFYIIAGLVLILSIQSCSYVKYTTSSSVSPIAETPTTFHKKGDLVINAGVESYNVADDIGSNWFVDESDFSLYNFRNKIGFQTSINAAVSDNFGIGFGYQANGDKPAFSHSMNASFQYYKLFETKEDRNFRVDVKTGFQYNTGKNYMSIDEVYWSEYEIEEPEGTYIYYDYEEFPLGYYKLNQKDFNVYIQPSGSFENKHFEASIGAVIGYNHILQYEPEFEVRYSDYNYQEAYLTNPLIYYDLNKDFAFGEVFASIGGGPEPVHFVATFGGGVRSDDIQSNYFFFQLGAKARFNIAKKEEVIKEF